MKILLAVDNLAIAHQLFPESRQVDLDRNSLRSFKQGKLEMDLLVTGHTQYETSFCLGKVLARNFYNLILQLGLAGTWDEKLKPGTPVNVINEKPAFLGTQSTIGMNDAYELHWLDKTAAPHVRGGYINMTNAYFNVFLPFQKVASITTTMLEGDEELIKMKKTRYPHHCETTNGLAFQHACLSTKLPFYQIRVISHNLANAEREEELAMKNLAKSADHILKLL